MKIILKLILAAILFIFVNSLFAQTTGNDCICPILKLIEPSAPVKPGETAIFSAEISGHQEATFNWTVNTGTIIQGQGTPVIKVDTTGLDETVIRANVEISGNWCPVCDNTKASGAAVVIEDRKPILIDKFTRVNCEEVLARTDNFLIELQNNPVSTGHIITYGTSRAVRRTEREMRNWIRVRGFGPSRIVFVNGGGGGGNKTTVEMWLVPPGAELPQPSPPPKDEAEAISEKEAVDKTKPYIYGSKFVNGVEGCDEYDLEGYAEALQENSESRGNIVVFETSRKLFRITEKEILEELAKSGVARNKIKTFFVKVKPDQLREGIELWLLPSRRK